MNLEDIRNIAVIGLGYVGFVTSVCLASKGYSVIGVDVVPEIVAGANEGKIPFHELGLNDLLEKSLGTNQFAATTDYRKAVLESDLIFITVGTPSNAQGAIDLSAIKDATRGIGTHLDEKFRVISIRSTIIPGTTDSVVLPILERESGLKAGKDFGLSMVPEFLKEGSAVNDFFHPDMTVIGYLDDMSGDLLEEFFKPYGGAIFKTNLSTAEMIKYANNAFLATKISFINEIANICRLTEGVDVRDVAHGIGLDKRVSPHFLRAGSGFGGSCLPKDLKGLISFAKKSNYNPILLEATLQSNEFQAQYMIDMAISALGPLENKKVALLGLAFKPNTSDMREAASIRIINRLQKYKNVQIRAYDPAALREAETLLGSRIIYSSSVEDCLKDADICFIITEWDEFKELTPSDFKELMKTPIIIDGRKIYDPKSFPSDVKLLQIGYKN